MIPWFCSKASFGAGTLFWTTFLPESAEEALWHRLPFSPHLQNDSKTPGAVPRGTGSGLAGERAGRRRGGRRAGGGRGGGRYPFSTTAGGGGDRAAAPRRGWASLQPGTAQPWLGWQGHSASFPASLVVSVTSFKTRPLPAISSNLQPESTSRSWDLPYAARSYWAGLSHSSAVERKEKKKMPFSRFRFHMISYWKTN